MIDSKLPHLGSFPIFLQLENIWNLGRVTQKPPAPNGHSWIPVIHYLLRGAYSRHLEGRQWPLNLRYFSLFLKPKYALPLKREI